MDHTPTEEQAAILLAAYSIMLSARSHKSHGKYFALVDEEDYERLSTQVWTLQKKITPTGRVLLYALRRFYNEEGVKKTEFMHNAVLNREASNRQVVDHRNRNGLDNRKENLRIVTQHENMINCERTDNARGYFWHKTLNRYVCRWRGRYVGCFKTEAEAIVAVMRVKQC